MNSTSQDSFSQERPRSHSLEISNMKRMRTGSVSGRLRAASDLEEHGFISKSQKGLIKDLIISGDQTLQDLLDKYEKGQSQELLDFIRDGFLERKDSIDILEGLDFEFLSGLQDTGSFDFVDSNWQTDLVPPPTTTSSSHPNQYPNHLSTGSSPSVSQQSPNHSTKSIHSNNPLQVTSTSNKLPVVPPPPPMYDSEFHYKPRRESLDSINIDGFLDDLGHFDPQLSETLGIHESEDDFNNIFHQFANETPDVMNKTKANNANKPSNNPNISQSTASQASNQYQNNVKKTLRVGGNALPHDHSDVFDDAYLYENVDLSAYATHAANLQATNQQQKKALNIRPKPDVKNTTISTISPSAASLSQTNVNGQVNPVPTNPLANLPPDAAKLGYIGAYSPDARRARIEKFLEKRNRRVWTRKVKYDVRKNFADSRLRIKGRFVKKEDEDMMRELLTI